MIARKLKSNVRRMLAEGKSEAYIRQTAGSIPSIVTLAIRHVKSQVRKKQEHTRRWKMTQKREAKKWAWQQNYRIAPHLLLLKEPVKCKDCGASVSQIMRKYRDFICGECGMKRHKRDSMTRPLTAALALALLVICGCQAPSKADISVRVAGQEVVMNFRK